MSFLLLPEDERPFITFLCEELGLRLLLDDLASGGVARVATDPLRAVPAELPFGIGRTLIFWASSLGPVRTMADAPHPKDAADRVARALTAQAAGARFPDVIDFERTPVLR